MIAKQLMRTCIEYKHRLLPVYMFCSNGYDMSNEMEQHMVRELKIKDGNIYLCNSIVQKTGHLVTVLELFNLLTENQNSNIYSFTEEMTDIYVSREILGVIGLNFGLVLVTSYNTSGSEIYYNSSNSLNK